MREEVEVERESKTEREGRQTVKVAREKRVLEMRGLQR